MRNAKKATSTCTPGWKQALKQESRENFIPLKIRFPLCSICNTNHCRAFPWDQTERYSLNSKDKNFKITYSGVWFETCYRSACILETAKHSSSGLQKPLTYLSVSNGNFSTWEPAAACANLSTSPQTQSRSKAFLMRRTGLSSWGPVPHPAPTGCSEKGTGAYEEHRTDIQTPSPLQFSWSTD